MPRDEAIELAILSLYEAADADSATGGPDSVRGIYPVVATVTADGYVQLDDEDVAERFGAIIERRRASNGNAEGTLR
jgi:proteasome beta subunit